jgi:5-methyltetrahydropteroyltriglutamate--homocysteine methyltransferase
VQPRFVGRAIVTVKVGTYLGDPPMLVHTSLTGPFPRSEALVQATRDLDRGRTTPEAVDELFDRTEREVLALEERLGVDAVTGGYLRWADLFRPFAESWGGFTVGPVTRWFETNTFYRQPILHAPPQRVPGAVAARLPAAASAGGAKRAKVILPGPYTFAGLLDNRSGETLEGLTQRLGRLLAEEVKDLAHAGHAVFQFQEPLLVTKPPEGATAESVVAAYKSLAPSLQGSTSIVWTYFADALPAFPLLGRLPVDVIGVDLAETDAQDIPALPDHKSIGLGCIDPRTTLVEDPHEVARIVRRLSHRLRPPSIWLGPGGPLDLLPWEPATRKLHLLPGAQRAIADHDGGR